MITKMMKRFEDEDRMMMMKTTLHVKLITWGSRCAVGRPHTLRRPSRDPVARVIGTTGRGGAAAVRRQEYDMLHLAFHTPTVRPFTDSWDAIRVLTTRSVEDGDLFRVRFPWPLPKETEPRQQVRSLPDAV